ncbi:hypothetical protein [Rheinheimera maricola]|uniref:Immunity protein 30 domain-containing protein n=1 Tax=Rheinheimera maricola TaxID=2793282 RepID=A0ABS7XA57_9GAMM|nr:hypothetical protein [Rheinheimera maricola]MBZ9612444.1 hypothetical protein [Rheinheimera maricola]
MATFIDGINSATKSIDELLFELNTSADIKLKHAIAMILSDFDEPRIVDHLVAEISKEVNHGYIGTFVFTCETFDCSKYLEFFLQLIVFGEYEVSMTSALVVENMSSLHAIQIADGIVFLQNNLNKTNSKNEEFIEEALAFLKSELIRRKH